MSQRSADLIQSFQVDFPIRDVDGEATGKIDAVTVDPNKLCSLESCNLDEELERHPGNYAWIAVLCARARAELERNKDDLGREAAKLDGEYRVAYEEAQKKITEKAIAAEVVADGEYQVQKDNVMGWQRNGEMLLAIRDALVHKRDCLVQLASLKRMELRQLGTE